MKIFSLIALAAVTILGLRGGSLPSENLPDSEVQDTLPSSFMHAVPFTSQAPLGVWNAIFQEACEEASMYMVAVAERKSASLSPAAVQEELLRLVRHEEERGLGVSISLDAVAEVLHAIYGIDSYVLEEPALEDVRNVLFDSLVILPVSGEELANPHYRYPYPPYHMVVVIGYDDVSREFVTHDPGTKFGKEYRYSYDLVMEAMHDWSGSNATVRNEGAKRVLVIPL